MSQSRLASALLFLCLGVAFLLACQKKPARFAHDQHLGLACGEPGQPECLTCVSCHSDLDRGAVSPGHPADQDCQKCHHRDSDRILLSMGGPKSAAAEQASQIQFDHPQHLAMKALNGQCISCHSGVVSEAGGPDFPPMATCFGCHEHQEQWDEGVCVPCHRQADLKKLFPQTYLKHGAGWDKRHGQAANMTTVQCAQCHSEESCDDCHNVSAGLKVELRRADSVEKDFVHPADFLTRHAMEASSEPGKCLTCHRTETCDSCHAARGISAMRWDAVNPHPPGWTGPDSMAPNHHGRAARRDIVACASCHDQGPQTNCIECHRVGGPGGNPHPSGWKSSRTPSDQMCNYCHEGGM